MIEKLIEFPRNCGGLKIAAGKRKSPKSLENQGFWAMVPVTGLEPVRHRWRWILSPENRLESGGSEWRSVEEYTSKYSREFIRISKDTTGAHERAPPADRA